MPSALRKSIWLVIISSWLILPVTIPCAAAQDDASSGNLKFNYAFVALPNTTESPRLVAIQNKHQLNSGDKLKIYLEALSEAYFYFFHLGPAGVLSQIFPENHQSARMIPDQKAVIPERDQWFELDSITGIEKFFLIASHERQNRLERLYEDYLKADENEPKKRLKKLIMDEIRKIRRENLSKNAERPVRIGGNFRDPGQRDSDATLDIVDLASNVTTNGTYSRSFTIDHR